MPMGLIVGLDFIDKEVLDHFAVIWRSYPKYGVGLDNIDIDECNERNIAIGMEGRSK